jgi:hypothetical protein
MSVVLNALPVLSETQVEDEIKAKLGCEDVEFALESIKDTPEGNFYTFYMAYDKLIREYFDHTLHIFNHLER